MNEGVTLFAVVVIVFVGLSAKIGRAHLTAPIFFMVAGALVGGASPVGTVDGRMIRAVAEVTLMLWLFHDAAQLRPRALRADWPITGRLLLVGLPVTIACCFVLARLLFPDLSIWLALLLGAALAPTDSGLAAATVLHLGVPARIRRVLNAESGLNDGLVTPVVFFAIAAAAGVSESAADNLAFEATLAILVGVSFGSVVGFLSGRFLASARDRGWTEGRLVPLAVLVVPLLAYYGANALDGNGFTASFLAGTTFAVGTKSAEKQHDLALTDMVSALLACAAWMLFGAAAAVHLARLVHWETLLFAVLSLTVLRMIPVAVCLIGSGLRPQTVAFVGWFGPRGLPSVVFVLVANESLRGEPELPTVVAAIAATVVLSVLAHGASAPSLARRYGDWVQSTGPTVETQDPGDVAEQHRARRPGTGG